jgi:hypothetical protein
MKMNHSTLHLHIIDYLKYEGQKLKLYDHNS